MKLPFVDSWHSITRQNKVYSSVISPQQNFRIAVTCGLHSEIPKVISRPVPAGHNVNISSSLYGAVAAIKWKKCLSCDPSGFEWKLINGNNVVTDRGCQEMCCAKGRGFAYSRTWRVMVHQNPERKLLMVRTSIFNALFLAISVFCWGQVWIGAPYFITITVIILLNGTVAQYECV